MLVIVFLMMTTDISSVKKLAYSILSKISAKKTLHADNMEGQGCLKNLKDKMAYK